MKSISFGKALGGLTLACVAQLAAQSSSHASPAQPMKPPVSRQSITVSATLSPEDREDSRINKLYQDAYKLEQQHNCGAAVGKYISSVIPTAQSSSFKVPRNKFLYLSYRGVGTCKLSEDNFAEAEQAFTKSMEYLPVWPGTGDSDYPITYQLIGQARMGEEHWGPAQEALQRAVEIYKQQIEADGAKNWTELRDHIRISRLGAEYLLAVDLFRQRRAKEALTLLDEAYNQALEYGAPPTMRRAIAQNGEKIANSIGDKAQAEQWTARIK